MRKSFTNIIIKIAATLSMFVMAQTSSALDSGYKHFGTVRNLVNADNKQYHFGFILGFNAMDFNATQSNLIDEMSGKRWYADQTSLDAGFTVGIISDLRLGEYFDLRFNPVLMFNDRTLNLIAEDGESAEAISVKSSIIDFPLLVKMRAQRMGNYRPYLIAGPAATLDLGRSKDCPILLKTMDIGLEFGFGFDIYLPYFRLAPEVKMFLGFNDILNPDRPDLMDTPDMKYTNALSKLTSRILTFTFNFE